MKTVKIILAAVVMSTMFFSCQKAIIEPQAQPTNDEYFLSVNPNSGEIPPVITIKNVIYDVNVNFVGDPQLCDTYWVGIFDGNGHLVSPKQLLVKGTLTYHFTERVKVEEGIRVARLVRDPNVESNCINHLYTPPVSQTITFEDMGKYFFDLYPVINGKNPKN
jgi:hypothetical protein